MGVSLGSSDVRSRNGYSLVAYQLEETLPFGVQRHAFVADGNGCLRSHRGHLSIRFCGNATLHIFPVLT